MCSSSTASAAPPAARSTSSVRVAVATAAVAARSESSSRREMWCRMAISSPLPKRTRISVKVPAYHQVSLSRRRASDGAGLTVRSLGKAESIPGPAQRRDQFRTEAVIDLAAQAPHQYVEHVREGIVILIPDVRRDGGAIDDLALVPHKQLQQGELLGGQLDRSGTATHRAGAQVHLEVRDAVSVGCEGQRSPPRQRLQPRDQLLEGERLGEVVVRADLETTDSVVHCIERRQHQDGRRDVVAAQL